ncbi:hypothetical protein B7P34_18740 [Streptosporangium nondiastaticum]|uniref:Uncharacterized protein n=1 Tax=Streptosporangium nondiastaticum TaxID=35764 RepID=A0A9X7JP66_9ACTN|nr:hypothetical protein B7P34_18740 [Streptosporangium nondiastaticum]
MGSRGVARGGQEGVLPRARTHYARTGPTPCIERNPRSAGFHRLCSIVGMPLVTGREQLTGSAKGQCSHLAH